MKIRERIRQILIRFERAVTRVEDSSARIEQKMGNVERILTQLSDSWTDVRVEFRGKFADSEQEMRSVKERMAVLEKQLGAPRH